MLFFSKTDRCTGTAQRSDGPKRYKLASMNFTPFRETLIFCLPRSYRAAEKSDPVGSREPNYAVFQQITTVVQAQVDAPMDPSAVIAQA